MQVEARRIWAKCGRIRGKYGRIRTHAVGFGPNLVDPCRFGAKFGRCRANVGQIRAQFWPMLGKRGRFLADVCNVLAELGGFRRIQAKLGCRGNPPWTCRPSAPSWADKSLYRVTTCVETPNARIVGAGWAVTRGSSLGPSAVRRFQCYDRSEAAPLVCRSCADVSRASAAHASLMRKRPICTELTTSGQLRPKLVQTWPRSTRLKSIWADRGLTWRELGQAWPNLANFDKIWTMFGRSRPESAQFTGIGPHSGQNRPESGPPRSKLIKLGMTRARLGGNRPESVEVGQKVAKKQKSAAPGRMW